jgi:hypothetical protein
MSPDCTTIKMTYFKPFIENICKQECFYVITIIYIDGSAESHGLTLALGGTKLHRIKNATLTA